jgi:beta-lactamase regulating signal transducer with metallopeptidase domain
MNNTILTVLSLSASGSILALILLALRPVLKNKVSKAFQYYIWLLVLLRLALPLSFDNSIMNQVIPQTGTAPALVILTPDESGKGMLTREDIPTQGNGQNAGQIAPSETTLGSVGVSEPDPIAASGQTHFNIWEFIVENQTAIWLLGAFVHFSWFIIAYLRFSWKIRKTCVEPHPWDTESFSKLRGNTNIQLACNPYITTPMMIGFSSPCIIIPQLAFVVNGMGSELEHILQHELTHYRRRDLLYKWFVVLVSSLHWFNPLMILIRREISRACELSCDEAVVRYLDVVERQGYGETLLAIASNKRLPTGIVTTTMCEEKLELKERLESIMTYKRKNVLMVAVSLTLTLLLAGCSVALGAANVTQLPAEPSPSSTATETPIATTMPDDEISQSPIATATPVVSTMPDNEVSPSPEATDAPSVSPSPSAASSAVKSENTKPQAIANDPVLEAYNAVLQNKVEFFSTDNKKKLYLKDFLTNKEIYETTFTVTHFAVLDMDGDKVPEVVLELSVGGEPQFYEVLHYTNNAVNGYLIVYRGLTELKADGSFLFSSGAADSGVGKLKFEATAYTTDMLGYSQSSQDGDNLTISYFINNQSATKKAFDSFMNEQTGKKNAVWYKFSQTNIETELS